MNERDANEAFESQDRYIHLLNREVEQLKIDKISLQNQQNQTSNFQSASGNKDNLAELQLELEKDLLKIAHALKGDVLVIIDGNEIWQEPKDDRYRTLTDYGVKELINLLQIYTSKNILLSFYDDEIVKWKVRDFGVELADLIFNRMEDFFYYPTPEELYEKYRPYVENLEEEELYKKCIQWSREEMQKKFRSYPLIVMSLIDFVDASYRRAIRGEERDSLRKMMHISQTANQNIDPKYQPEKASLFKVSTWNRL